MSPLQVSTLGDLRDQGRMTTGSVASAIWVARAAERQALVFIEIDGELLEVSRTAVRRSRDELYRDEGGES